MPVCPKCRVGYMDGESHACGVDRNWRQKPELGEKIDPGIGPFANFLKGNLGLLKTYWLYGVVGGLVVRTLLSIVGFAVSSPTVPAIGSLAWQCTVGLAVWRAAAVYPGSKLWSTLARIAVVLGIILTSVAAMFEMGLLLRASSV